MEISIHCDGGSRGNPGPAASAFAVYKGEEKLFSDSEYLGRATNNVAEYKSLLMAYEWLRGNSEKVGEKVVVYMDSQLVVKQMNGEYKIKSKQLMPYVMEIKKISRDLPFEVTHTHVEREKNKEADRLVNERLDEASQHV